MFSFLGFNGNVSELTKNGDTRRVSYLLHTGTNPNAIDKRGLTALHHACVEGNDDLLALLLKFNADVNIQDNEQGWTALQHASYYRRERAVSLLLKHGVSPISKEESLRLSCRMGYEAIVRLLLDNVTDINATDPKSGETPLLCACVHSQESIVRILVHFGADVNTHDKTGHTALEYACLHGLETVMFALLESDKTNFSRKNKGGTLALTYAREYCTFPVVLRLVEAMFRPQYVYTALHHACLSGGTPIISFLLETGCNINKQDEDGITPLHAATSCGAEFIVRLLLQRGATVNIQDNRGLTPMHYACAYGHLTVVRLLLRHSHLDIADTDGRTPLQYACLQGHHAIVELLLTAGYEVNTKDNHGMSCLHHSCRQGHDGIIQQLLDAGADCNAECLGDWAETPLQIACIEGNKKIVRRLLLTGRINIAKENKACPSCLHMAVMSTEECEGDQDSSENTENTASIIKMLLANGIDLKALTPDGRNLIDIPEINHFISTEVLQLNFDLHTSFQLEGLGMQLLLRQTHETMENALAVNDFDKAEKCRVNIISMVKQIVSMGLRADLSDDELCEKAQGLLLLLEQTLSVLKNNVNHEAKNLMKAKECHDVMVRIEEHIHQMTDPDYTHSVTDELRSLEPILEEFNLEHFIAKDCPRIMDGVSGWERILEDSKIVAYDRIAKETLRLKRLKLSNRENPLSFNQALAIAVYTFGAVNFFTVLNNLLRKRKKKIVRDLHPYLHFLLSGLNRLPAQKTVVYRGIPVEHLQGIREEYTASRKVHWSAFTSTTTSITTAKEFAGEGGIIFNVRVVSGRSVQAYSSVEIENEILMGPNSRFVVFEECSAAPEEDGFYYVKLVEQGKDSFVY